MKRTFLAAAAMALLVGVGAAQAATTFTLTNFTNITGNVPDNVGNGQLSVRVTGDAGDPNVLFEFFNNVGIQSSITDVYFSDDLGLFNTTITQITDSGAGVAFDDPATPGSLPGEEGTSFFDTTIGLSADSDPPVAPNGVNASTEWLAILLTLAEGNTFTNFLLSGFLGTFQIGMHIQGFENGGSDSYVNGGGGGGFPDPQIAPVPIPGALLLFGSALAGLGLLARSRSRKTNANLVA